MYEIPNYPTKAFKNRGTFCAAFTRATSSFWNRAIARDPQKKVPHHWESQRSETYYPPLQSSKMPKTYPFHSEDGSPTRGTFELFASLLPNRWIGFFWPVVCKALMLGGFLPSPVLKLQSLWLYFHLFYVESNPPRTCNRFINRDIFDGISAVHVSPRCP